jgi:heme/copper-type cytochrome/quinol oxidase subunit 1
MTDHEALAVIFLVFIAIVSFMLYFFPSKIAHSRNHRNTTAILIANIFFGWTFVGWVICLVWAFTNDKEI